METPRLDCYSEDLPGACQLKTVGSNVTEAEISNFLNATGILHPLGINNKMPFNMLNDRAALHVVSIPVSAECAASDCAADCSCRRAFPTRVG